MGLTAIAPATLAVAASLTNDLNTDIFLLATICLLDMFGKVSETQVNDAKGKNQKRLITWKLRARNFNNILLQKTTFL